VAQSRTAAVTFGSYIASSKSADFLKPASSSWRSRHAVGSLLLVGELLGRLAVAAVLAVLLSDCKQEVAGSSPAGSISEKP